MLSHALFVLVSITSLATAQSIDPSTIPKATRGKNPLKNLLTNNTSLLTKTLKDQWCQQQETSCPLICMQLPGSSSTETNKCDAVSSYIATNPKASVSNQESPLKSQLSASPASVATASLPMLPNTLRRYHTLSAPPTIPSARPTATATRPAKQPAFRNIPAVPKIQLATTPQALLLPPLPRLLPAMRAM